MTVDSVRRPLWLSSETAIAKSEECAVAIVNKLPRVDEGCWQLEPHAHIVVFDEPPDDELLTVYDCGAAQKPPSAQLRGNLVNVRARAQIDQTTTGYTVALRENASLVEQTPDRYVVVPR